MIHINQLSKKYKDADSYSVSSLDLLVETGEIFGLLGPNGAGKTFDMDYYAENTTNTCGLTCPSPSFADNFSRYCVVHCPD